MASSARLIRLPARLDQSALLRNIVHTASSNLSTPTTGTANPAQPTGSSPIASGLMQEAIKVFGHSQGQQGAGKTILSQLGVQDFLTSPTCLWLQAGTSAVLCAF